MMTIGAVARQTGIAAETLRKWELRYGFPVPLRTDAGHRVFRNEDIEKIHNVAKAIALGQRAASAIQSVTSNVPSTTAESKTTQRKCLDQIAKAMNLLKANDLSRYQEHVEASFDRLGIVEFIQDFAIPLIHEVGAQWQASALPPFREHAFASHLSGLVDGWSQRRVQQNPRLRPTKEARPVLLGLPAGEQHYIALSLLGAMLHEGGVPTITFKSGLPASQIALAAKAYGARAVALSCSEASPKKLLAGELTELRSLLSKGIALWVGGAGAIQLPADIDGIGLIHSMQEVVDRAIVLDQK